MIWALLLTTFLTLVPNVWARSPIIECEGSDVQMFEQTEAYFEVIELSTEYVTNKFNTTRNDRNLPLSYVNRLALPNLL